ncbi:transmembrane protein 56-B-like isoform X1 [Python bivittatus]|uniref:Transmembrane protein 56-B-like isoform X1 n=1 Tax=Python bivittatus TaxID=176946 RepID=A0A9F5IA66_PYTBI|nr:transmembrane protein 56-B-like isoform X1 [Python bivittatus]XP_025019059.1 transmembrane protein 56-B-like isoform X1 [Python bivittatus]
MEDFTRLGYCIVAGSFVAFQFSFSALSPQLSLSLSPSYSSLPSVKQSEWNSRCVSTLHAMIVGLFCLYILWFDDAVNANPIWGDPWLVKLNVAVTCGYLLYDLLLLVRYWKTLGDSLFVCHHLAALYAYGYVLVSSSSGGVGRREGFILHPFKKTAVLLQTASVYSTSAAIRHLSTLQSNLSEQTLLPPNPLKGETFNFCMSI